MPELRQGMENALMKLAIVGDGSFGTFLKELLDPLFILKDNAYSVILAVPIEAYASVGAQYQGKHLINVCSVQRPSTSTLLNFSDNVTSIHPLFGRRTPVEHRNSILTHRSDSRSEEQFLEKFVAVSRIISTYDGGKMDPDTHDLIMAMTHKAGIRAALDLSKYVERAKNIPDTMIPHSFRLLRQFVKTLEDMPAGTLSSINANPYA